MEMCITGYSVMDNSIKQSVIRHFHNVDYAGIPIILSFLFKSSIKKSPALHRAFQAPTPAAFPL